MIMADLLALFVIVAGLLLLADLHLGRPDHCPGGAGLAAALLVRARPGRLALVVLVMPLLVGAGALTIARALAVPALRLAVA
jgi:hypothetical protein